MVKRLFFLFSSLFFFDKGSGSELTVKDALPRMLTLITVKYGTKATALLI
jgi:hypothetical protein